MSTKIDRTIMKLHTHTHTHTTAIDKK